MIAAVRRRIGAACAALPKATAKWSRRADRAADRALERAHPVLLRAKRRSLALASAFTARVGPRLRPPTALFFRGLALGERSVRRGGALGVRAATAASRVVTPQRAIAAVIVATGLCLIAAQFIDYRGVEIGQ
ncbi:MAG TPA: hypothetical protein VGO24_10985, partial [Solirubrobacterales bacterium]|nr:hypothetical protein [Solirubrobacterales bacterium]